MTSSHAQRTRALLQAEDAAMHAQVQALTHASGWERESALHALTPANSTAVTLVDGALVPSISRLPVMLSMVTVPLAVFQDGTRHPAGRLAVLSEND